MNFLHVYPEFLRDWRSGSWAFLLASVRLGVVGRERWQYWRLVGWTVSHRPVFLHLAVSLAIYGHHFRRCCTALRP